MTLDDLELLAISSNFLGILRYFVFLEWEASTAKRMKKDPHCVAPVADPGLVNGRGQGRAP